MQLKQISSVPQMAGRAVMTAGRPRQRWQGLRAILLVCAAALGVPAAADLPDEQLEAETRMAFDRLAPVGMAVAVVRPDGSVWLGAHGMRIAGSGQAVDADTVFPIHSMTKSFTATALAMLVDEGKLSWSDPVRKHIPEFAMSDPYVSAHLTIRDLLVHNSGLAVGAGDLLHWPDQTATAAEFIAALRYLPLEQGFREGFAYDNTLYIVAGEVVQRASGLAWDTFVRRRIFAPLGMTSCVASGQEITPFPAASQHTRAADGAPQLLGNHGAGPDPAGSIACSVRDVATWTRFHLGDGTLTDGSRLLSTEQLRILHKPVVALAPPNFMRRLAGAHFNDVALGWFALDFAGTLALEHGGLGLGGITNMIMLPDRKAAVVVLVNDLIPAHFLSHRLADLMVRAEQASDWIGYVAEREQRRLARSTPDSEAQAQRPAAAAPPGRDLAAYTGTYRDPWYGDIIVADEGGQLTLHFTRSRLLRGPLIAWDGETFLVRWPDRSLNADALVTFVSDARGQISGMRLRAVSPETDFSYDYHHLAPVKVSSELPQTNAND
jgi:CubicO group peptidase (beta-lactamase class C family)